MLLSYYSKLEKVSLSDYKTKKRMEMRLRRWIFSLSKKGIIFINKIDGLIWVKPNPAKIVDLILNISKTQTLLLSNVRGKHYARFEASGFLMRKHTLSKEDWDYLHGLFEEYVEDVAKRVIVIGRYEEFQLRVRLLRYSHRFMSSRLYDVLKQYDAVWSNASKRFDRGVFMNLTKDPKTFKNLYYASNGVLVEPKRRRNPNCKRLYRRGGIHDSFNRFMSYLRGVLGYRPDYIAVLEPMDKGFPHLHVVIWGVDMIELIPMSGIEAYLKKHESDDEFMRYIRKHFKGKDIGKIDISRLYKAINHFELTKLLKKHGFGEIHYEYRIRREGSTWVWYNKANKPRRARTMNVQDYLKKYLVKVFEAQLNENCKKTTLAMEKISFYFATNKRFFTYSTSLIKYENEGSEKKESEKESDRKLRKKEKVSYGWFFIGSWYWLDIPEWVLELANVVLAPSSKYVWKAETLDPYR